MMKLSVGVFVRLLRLCANSDITNIGLLTAIVSAVDPDRKYNIDDMLFNRLVKCKHNLSKPADIKATGEMRFADIVPVARSIDLDKLVKAFSVNITTKISADKRGSFVLAIRDIIGKDNEIDSVNPRAFEEYIGMPRAEFLTQNEIYLPEFLTRVFLYSLLEVDNTAGLGCEDDDDCPVKDAKSEAHLNPGKNRAVKPEQKEKIAEAIDACGKDCVLRVNEDFIAKFDAMKGIIEFVEKPIPIVDANRDKQTGTSVSVVQHGDNNLAIGNNEGAITINMGGIPRK